MGEWRVGLTRMRNLSATALLLLSIGVTSRAAVLPSEKQLLDTLHQALSAPTKETGLRLKRSTSEEWDKELDLTAIGALFRVKFNDVEKPELGGKAHIKFPGSRFIRNAPFDDVDLQVEFDGSRLHEGLLDLKIDYKFVQKFKHKADLPRQGSISLTRSLESGEWGNKLVMKRASNEQTLEHLLDLSFKSATKPNPQSGHRLCDFMASCDIIEFSSIVDYKVGNYFDLKGKIYPWQKANIDLTVNGFVYSAKAELDLVQKKLTLIAVWESHSFFIDFEVNPGDGLGVAVKGNLGAPLEAELVMQPNLTLGQFKISFDGQNLAFAQLKGEADIEYGLPKTLNYVLKYNIGSEAGKAKIEFEKPRTLTGGPALQITLVPTTTTEKSIEHILKISLSGDGEGPYFSTFRNQWDIQLEGTNVQKTEGILYVNNNSTEFHLTTDSTLEQTKENPFFETWNKLYGTEVTRAKKTRQIYFSKNQMDEILNNRIVQLRVNKVLFEEESLVNGQSRYHLKYDNRAPKTKYLLSYAPQDHPEAEWKYEGGWFQREVGFNELINELKLDHKITHGETVVQEGMISFQSASNLPLVAESYLQTLTTSPESPVYPLIQTLIGRHGSKIIHQCSLGLRLNLDNFKLITSLTVDEDKISEVLIDNHNSGLRKVTLKRVWSPETFGANHEVTVDWKPESINIPVSHTGLKLTMDYKRANQSILSYTNKASWETSEEDFIALIVHTKEELIQTEESPLYSWGPTLQGKYWKDAKRTLKLETMPNLIISEETFLDEELYRKIDVVINEDRSCRFSWEQPDSGEVFPSTRDVFNQDKVEFTMAHRPSTISPDAPLVFELTSNLPNVQSLNATFETIPEAGAVDTLAKLTLNGADLVTLRTDHTDNSMRLTVLPGEEDEMMVSLAITSMPYPAWPSTLLTQESADILPNPESPTARKLVFNMTRGENRVDTVMSGLDNFFYGHSMFEPQSIGLDVSGNVPSLGEFKISREAQFQVFGEPTKISTFKIQWSGRDEISEGDFAAFSPMDTMVVVDITDTEGDSSIESYLKSSNIQAYKSFGGKRWGFNLSKDNVRIITGIDCKDPISC